MQTIRQQLADYGSEQLIMESVMKKDKAVFSFVYDKYASALFGIIYRITGDMLISERVLLQSFCVFWDSASTPTAIKTRVFTRLMRIAGGLAREACITQQSDTAGKNNFAVGNEENNKFVAATTHSVIDLIYINGCNFSEAAEKAGCCDAELKTRLQSEIGALRLGVK